MKDKQLELLSCGAKDIVADEKQLEVLLSGTDSWNLWRTNNPTIRINLARADLSKVNLSGANLIEANLSYANLSYSNLTGAYFNAANLIEANLSRTNFRGADLREARLRQANLGWANLSMAHLLKADLRDSLLTGSCLQDWHINASTNLSGVQADYVYLKFGGHEFYDRRPHSGNFKPGEFAALFQQVLDTLDLIFVDGIDWQAFFASFQELRQQYNNADLTIQAIEKKSGGSFVVRLEVPEEADKAAIEQSAKANYQQQLQLVEARYQAQLQAKDEVIDSYKKHSAEMSAIAQALANTPRTNFSQYNYGDSTGFQNDMDNSTANQGKAIDISQNPPTGPESA